MFNHNHGMATIHKSVKDFNQTPYIRMMESDGGLFQDE